MLWCAVKLQDIEDVGGCTGVNWRAVGPEADAGLRDMEGGLGSSLGDQLSSLQGRSFTLDPSFHANVGVRELIGYPHVLWTPVMGGYWSNKTRESQRDSSGFCTSVAAALDGNATPRSEPAPSPSCCASYRQCCSQRAQLAPRPPSHKAFALKRVVCFSFCYLPDAIG